MKAFIETMIREAGELAMTYYGTDLEKRTKSSPVDFVTDADVAVGKFITKKIKEQFPDHSIVNEEADKINGSSADTWYIDPIDGTANFAFGVPLWCIMIAYRKDDQTQCGAVYSPTLNEFFWAEKGKGAFRNGVQMHVSDIADFEKAKVYFSIRAKRSSSDQLLKMFMYLYNLGRGNPKRFGTMLGACYTAAGAFDAFANNMAYDFDNMAPLLIAEEAGATVTDATGKPWQPGSDTAVIANPALHKELMQILNN